MSADRAPKAILVLCGLPGAGKTTVSRTLTAWASEHFKSHIIVQNICFDDVYNNLATAGQEFCPQLWQASRRCAIDYISTLLQQPLQCWKIAPPWALEGVEASLNGSVRQGAGGSMCAVSRQAGSEPPAAQQHSVQDSTDCSHSGQRGLIIVDDNNFYSSMRKEFFQLATRHAAAYLQMHLVCSPSTSASRNVQRPPNERVPCHVLQHMIEQFEPPADGQWQANTIRFDCEQADVDPGQLWGLIEQCWGPAACSSSSEDDSRQRREEGQASNSTSALHQIDLWSRKLVSESVAKYKVDSASLLKGDFAKMLNKDRKRLLDAVRQDIQQGALHGDSNSSAMDARKHEFMLACFHSSQVSLRHGCNSST